MRKLILSVIAVLFITTSAFALTDVEIKAYVGKHIQITKKLKAMKVLQTNINAAKQVIYIQYNRAAMITALNAVDALYKVEKDILNAEYKILVEQIEVLIP